MSRKFLAIAVIATVLTAQQARAADGSINFNGELIAQTCTVAVNGVVTPAVATVTLPTVSGNLLLDIGATAGQTGFNIQLSNCLGTATTASAFFEPGPSVGPGGMLINSGTAAFIRLQLLEGSGVPILVGQSSQASNNQRHSIDGSGNATLPYAVRYYTVASLPGLTPVGTVVSTVNYTINYQ